MTTPILLTGWEHGVTPAASTGGGLGDAISGTPTVVSTQANTGTYSLRCYAATDATPRVQYSLATPNVLVGRIYFRFAAWPSIDNEIVYTGVTAGAQFAIKISATTHKLFARFFGVSSGTEHATACNLDTWYRLDFKFDFSTGTSTIDFQLDGVDGAQLTRTQSASTFTTLMAGVSNTGTLDMYLDDLVVTAAGTDYPLGPGGTQGLSPSGDGTHNAGTNVMEDNDGNDIGAVTAYDHVNTVPISDASTYIRQAANGTGNYAAVNFANISATHSAILGAEALLAYTAASTSANTGGCIVTKDDYATSTTLWGAAGALADYSDGSTSAPFYKRVIVAGVVDDTTVNALAARLGYSDDANPDPYWLNLLIEAGYTTAAGAIIGAAAGSVVLLGTLSGAGELTGAGTGLTMPVGTLIGSIEIVGLISGAADVIGTLAGMSAIAGSVTSDGTGIGTLSGAGALNGSIAVYATQNGEILGATSLVGSSVCSTTADGALQGSGALIGTAPGTAALIGTLDGASGLIGISTGVANIIGTLIGDGALDGSATGLVALGGILDGAGALAGNAAGLVSGTGTLTEIGPGTLIGSVVSASSLAGILLGIGELASASSNVASASGTLSGSGFLTGETAGETTYNATLTVASTTGELIGVGVGEADIVATITASGILYGEILASATVDAIITADGALLGSVTGSGYVIGLLYDGSWHASGTRTIYESALRGTHEASLRANIDAERHVSIMAED